MSFEKYHKKSIFNKKSVALLGSMVCLGLSLNDKPAQAKPASIKPGLEFVGVDIDVRNPNPEFVDSQLDRAKAVGFNALRMITTWSATQAEAYNDVPMLEHAVRSARERGIEPMLTVTPCWQSPNCLAPTSSNQRRFVTTLSHLAQELDVKYWIIGNEPNNPIFWDFQYSKNGESRAPESYYNLLVRSYDELKSQSADNIVICGALASSGNDNPDAKKPSHSVYSFIEGMAKAYKESGRSKPFCNVLAIHSYGATQLESPDTPHPGKLTASFGDYEEVVKTWDKEFKGTAQPKVPIFYSEYGIESSIPANKSNLYYNKQGERISENNRVEFMDKAYSFAACQARVIGLNNFLLDDEQDLYGWQSGLYYSDASPKPSLPKIMKSINDAKIGDVDC